MHHFPQPYVKIHRKYEDPNQREQPRISISSQKSSPSAMLVEEMMVMAGEMIGKVGKDANIPLPYRGKRECAVDVLLD